MKKLHVLIVSLISVMTSCSYGSTLYLVANTPLASYKSGDFVKKVKEFFDKNMDKKYFSSVKYLKEDEEAPDFSVGDYYVFLFGWGDSDRSTVFFRPDGYFRKYQDLNKIKNPSIIVFIPLTEEKRDKILKSLYLELLEARWGFNYTDSDSNNLGDVQHCYLTPVEEKAEKRIDFSDSNNFSHILDWVKTAKDDIEKKIKEKEERTLKRKEKEERDRKEREERKKKIEEERKKKEQEKKEKIEKSVQEKGLSVDRFASALQLIS